MPAPQLPAHCGQRLRERSVGSRPGAPQCMRRLRRASARKWAHALHREQPAGRRTLSACSASRSAAHAACSAASAAFSAASAAAAARASASSRCAASSSCCCARAPRAGLCAREAGRTNKQAQRVRRGALRAYLTARSSRPRRWGTLPPYSQQHVRGGAAAASQSGSFSSGHSARARLLAGVRAGERRGLRKRGHDARQLLLARARRLRGRRACAGTDVCAAANEALPSWQRGAGARAGVAAQRCWRPSHTRSTHPATHHS